MKYGYMRVSTTFENTKERNQTFDRQLMILKENGVEEKNIFQERISGGISTSKRVEYDKLMKTVRKGDTIVVTEMSRFSRSLQDLIESVNKLTDEGIGIVFIKENITIDSNGLNPMNKLIFQLFGAFAEFEKSLIAERVKMGMKASKEKGTVLGRPKRNIDMEGFITDYTFGNYTYEELAEKYNISRASVGLLIKKIKSERGE